VQTAWVLEKTHRALLNQFGRLVRRKHARKITPTQAGQGKQKGSSKNAITGKTESTTRRKIEK